MVCAVPVIYAYYLYDEEETEKHDHPEDFDDPDSQSFLGFLQERYEEWQSRRYDEAQRKKKEMMYMRRTGKVLPK